MMILARPSISLVIPTFNEESHLRACLEAIAAQTVQPVEVLVVDNNSTDNTVAIAHEFPIVTVLREPRQGVGYARDRGFNAARGDVIGRIDGDTRITPTWVADVQQVFLDKAVDAATGKVHYYEMSAPGLIDSIDLWARRYMAFVLGGDVALQGANMAIRREAWHAIRDNLCYRHAMHEDFDIAIHATGAAHKVIFTEAFAAYIGYRLAETSYREFIDYALTSPRTYQAHGRVSGYHMYPIVALVILGYWPLKILRRGYTPGTARFSLRQALTRMSERRVNPATYGDLG